MLAGETAPGPQLGWSSAWSEGCNLALPVHDSFCLQRKKANRTEADFKPLRDSFNQMTKIILFSPLLNIHGALISRYKGTFCFQMCRSRVCASELIFSPSFHPPAQETARDKKPPSRFGTTVFHFSLLALNISVHLRPYMVFMAGTDGLLRYYYHPLSPPTFLLALFK